MSLPPAPQLPLFYTIHINVLPRLLNFRMPSHKHLLIEQKNIITLKNYNTPNTYHVLNTSIDNTVRTYCIIYDTSQKCAKVRLLHIDTTTTPTSPTHNQPVTLPPPLPPPPQLTFSSDLNSAWRSNVPTTYPSTTELL